MNRPICMFGILFIFAASFVYAQETEADTAEIMVGFRRRAVIMDIDARVLENEELVIWSETHRRVAIPGNSVGVKLVGANVIVLVQFTPFIRRYGNNVLVTQGQIWYTDPERGLCFYTSLQTIPLEFGEPIHFFPLGTSERAERIQPSIEIIITVNRYTAAAAETAGYTIQKDE